MLSRPKPGTRVQVWYRAELRGLMPLHGLVGIVKAAARGPGPRNHAVAIDGIVYSIPGGQLRVWPSRGQATPHRSARGLPGPSR